MDFERLIAALNDYVIVTSVIVIAIRNSINCAALSVGMCVCVEMHCGYLFGRQGSTLSEEQVVADRTVMDMDSHYTLLCYAG